jgi:hypothetical protein
MKFTVTHWSKSVKELSGKGIFSKIKTTTFQSNGSVVSKLIWLKLDRNLSNAEVEERSPDGQCSMGVGPHVAVWNYSVSKTMTPQEDRHVNVPTNKDAFLEIVGLEFDAGIVLQD